VDVFALDGPRDETAETSQSRCHCAVALYAEREGRGSRTEFGEDREMAIHYFHCTDGVDLIFDRDGRDTGAFADTLATARAVAGELMHAVPSYREWDNWAVHVYDTSGPLEVVPFTDPARAAA
jgi:hypothetical protein